MRRNSDSRFYISPGLLLCNFILNQFSLSSHRFVVLRWNLNDFVYCKLGDSKNRLATCTFDKYLMGFYSELETIETDLFVQFGKTDQETCALEPCHRGRLGNNLVIISSFENDFRINKLSFSLFSSSQ